MDPAHAVEPEAPARTAARPPSRHGRRIRKSGIVTILLLDLTGVLYDYSHRARVAALAQASGRSPAQVEDIVFASGFFRRCVRGQMDEPAMREYLGQELGLHGDALDRAWPGGWTPRTAAMQLLRRLHPDVERALVTNNDALMTALLRTAEPIGALVPRMLCSGDLGVGKPDPGAFSAALRILGVRAEDARFVDDTRANVAAAASLGIQSAHTPDTAAFEAALRGWGLLCARQ